MGGFLVAISTVSVPSKLKKASTFGTFFGRQQTKILKIGTCKFGLISSTGENFTKQNFVIFSKMCGTYFHDSSRSQVTAWIYSSER